MERQLASIQKIINVKPHPNADKLDIINVLGWQLVSKKNEFKIGDLCVYIELDSVLPVTNPNFEFLAKSNGRIKTIRLRKELSQGIAFPVDILLPYAGTEKLPCLTKFPPHITETTMSIEDFITEGMDVTELLGITKYEPPEPSHAGQNFGHFGRSRGNFPSFIHKTDEIRLQGVLKVLEEIDGKECYASMKLDGSSCTVYSKQNIEGDRHFGVCSRNMEMKFDATTPEGRFSEAVVKLNIHNTLTEYCFKCNTDIALQGELISEGVQGNKLGIVGSDIRFFNAYNIKEGKYLDYGDFKNLLATLNLRSVPILMEYFKYDKSIHTLDFWLDFADKQVYDFNTVGSKEGYKHTAEGVVIRPVEECYSERLKGRMSFKVISNKYLLETGG